MDLATIVGIVAGFFLVALAILLGGEPLIFINIQGILIVLGGTVATTLIRFPLVRCLRVVGVVKKAFFPKKSDDGAYLVINVSTLGVKCPAGMP